MYSTKRESMRFVTPASHALMQNVRKFLGEKKNSSLHFMESKCQPFDARIKSPPPRHFSGRSAT